MIKGVIEIEGMEFYAYHGCFKEEQIVGNRFLVDLRLEADCTEACASDDIQDAVNYQIAYHVVKQEIEKKSHLLENIADRILRELFVALPSIEKAKVKVSKMNPPLGGKIISVSVSLEKYYSDYK